MNKGMVLGSATAALLFASGCSYSVLGPPFQTAPIAASSSVIYLYRPNVRRNAGVAMPVFVDDLPVGALYPGGYVPFHVLPGKHTVKMIVYGAVSQVTVNAEPKGESYVRYHTHFTGTELNLVSRDEGHNEIADCNLLPGGYDGRDRL